MMRLHRLRLRQFRPFEEADVAFDAGLCALLGRSGTGKSTLLEGIVWALFGAGAVRRSEGSLRRVGAPDSAPTAAHLEFSIDDRPCGIRRSLATDESGADAADLRCGGVVVATGPAAVTGAVSDMLNAGRERFMHACFTGRKELHQLAQLRPAERMRFLARLLGDDAVRSSARDPSAAPDPIADAVAALEAELAEADERMRTLATAPDLLVQYTTELERLRPELRLVEQETERLHDDWSQKRQAVDTRLEAYRRRAGELKQQIERLSSEGDAGVCPTCERALGPHVERMVARLDDEHYINVQDTKWLVQRQRQLGNRPPDLVEAETRRSRLRAAVEDRTQRAARCEQAMQELWTVATERQRAEERLESLQREAALSDRREAAPSDRREAAPSDRREAMTLRRSTLRSLAALAGSYLERITDGRYTGLSLTEDGRIYALAGDAPTPVVSGSDEDAIALVIRLATMQLAGAGHPGSGIMLLDEPFGSMDEERRRRALELIRSMTDDHPQIIISTRYEDVARHADHVRRVAYDRQGARSDVAAILLRGA
jgi:DNA repair protein SbcC/Rad50